MSYLTKEVRHKGKNPNTTLTIMPLDFNRMVAVYIEWMFDIKVKAENVQKMDFEIRDMISAEDISGWVKMAYPALKVNVHNENIKETNS